MFGFNPFYLKFQNKASQFHHFSKDYRVVSGTSYLGHEQPICNSQKSVALYTIHTSTEQLLRPCFR